MFGNLEILLKTSRNNYKRNCERKFGNFIPLLIFAALKKVTNMLIVDSKDCENIDKALKKYKKKYEKSKILLQLRERQTFTKPSVKRRNQILKAVYKQKISSGKIEL